MKSTLLSIVYTVIAALLSSANSAYSHCDTLDGPVIQSAMEALKKGDVTPVLKWVAPNDEKEIREVFAKVLTVRTGTKDARELADRHFFETLVRIHRAGEGEPYTGLKPAGTVEPGIAAADEAIKKGSVDELASDIAKLLGDGLRQRFAKVTSARQRADESIEAGRAYVKAYVEYIHYVEALHTLVSQPAGEHHHIHATAAREE
jgi:hypothetical protein